MPTSARTALMSVWRCVRCFPSTHTSPLVGASRWLMHLSRVLLPEPLGPMITTTSPRWTSRFTPRTASTEPKYLCRSLTTMMGSISFLELQAAFQPANHAGEEKRHGQVEEGQHVERLEDPEGAGAAQASELGELIHGQHGGG